MYINFELFLFKHFCITWSIINKPIIVTISLKNLEALEFDSKYKAIIFNQNHKKLKILNNFYMYESRFNVKYLLYTKRGFIYIFTYNKNFTIDLRVL